MAQCSYSGTYARIGRILICWGRNYFYDGTWQDIKFPQPYGDKPVVIATPNLQSDATSAVSKGYVVTARVCSVTTTGFKMSTPGYNGSSLYNAVDNFYGWVAFGWDNNG